MLEIRGAYIRGDYIRRGLYLGFYGISIYSIVRSWDSASCTSILTYNLSLFFIKILVQALIYPFRKEKHSSNFDYETGLFLLH